MWGNPGKYWSRHEDLALYDVFVMCVCVVGGESGVDDVLGSRVKGIDLEASGMVFGEVLSGGRRVFLDETDTSSGELLETLAGATSGDFLVGTSASGNVSVTARVGNTTSTNVTANTSRHTTGQNGTTARAGNTSGAAVDSPNADNATAEDDITGYSGQIPVVTVAVMSVSGAMVVVVASMWTGSLPSVKGLIHLLSVKELIHLPSMVAQLPSTVANALANLAGNGAVSPIPTVQSGMGAGANVGEVVFRD